MGPEGLTIDVLEYLTDPIYGHGAVTLLGTMGARHWANYFGSAAEVGKAERAVLEQARRVDLARQLDEREGERARELRSDPRIAAALPNLDRFGLAEYLAAGPALLERFKTGRMGPQPVGAAIVQAAVDWRRCGLLRPA